MKVSHALKMLFHELHVSITAPAKALLRQRTRWPHLAVLCATRAGAATSSETR